LQLTKRLGISIPPQAGKIQEFFEARFYAQLLELWNVGLRPIGAYAPVGENSGILGFGNLEEWFYQQKRIIKKKN
jgi:hypothetical protein